MPLVAALVALVLSSAAATVLARPDTPTSGKAPQRDNAERPKTKPKDKQSDKPVGRDDAGQAAAAAPAPFGIDAATAKRIVFACDGSGSMIQHWGHLRAQLDRAVESLAPGQSFVVVVFGNNGVQTFPPKNKGWARADAANKRKYLEWVADIQTTGRSTPLPALELAFAKKPDVIYFAGDEFGDQTRAIAGKVKALNRQKRVKVHTVAYGDAAGAVEIQAEFVEMMRGLAAANGGEFKTAAELNTDAGPGKDPAVPAPAAGADAPQAARDVTPPDADAADEVRTIAFVCDASTHTADTLPSLKAELSKAVNAIGPAQRVSVIFFGGPAGKPPRAFRGGAAVPATAETKRAVDRWLADLAPLGKADPAPAVALAFKAKPQLIYLLVGGDLVGGDAVAAKVAKLNTPRVAKVNTILYVASKDAKVAPALMDLLTRIARDNGGHTRLVAADE
jgi:hypothetical protein